VFTNVGKKQKELPLVQIDRSAILFQKSVVPAVVVIMQPKKQARDIQYTIRGLPLDREPLAGNTGLRSRPTGAA
jgi:hypothetical protein